MVNAAAPAARAWLVPLEVPDQYAREPDVSLQRRLGDVAKRAALCSDVFLRQLRLDAIPHAKAGRPESGEVVRVRVWVLAD